MAAPYDSYDYLSYWNNRSFEDSCERVCLERFLKKIGKQNSLVDIGGGFGRLSDLYAPFFKKCLVIDPSEKLLILGRDRHRNIKNLSFQKGKLPNLPLRDDSFDVALMIRVSHHLSQLSPSFKEISRLLRNQGYLILEVANKIHFLARLKAWLRGDFSFTKDLRSLERRSPQNIRQRKITFTNHHPTKVINELEKAGFSILEVFSVSNFRSPLLKKIFPERFLLALEKKLQKPLGSFLFGPSIFILGQKTE